MYHPTIQKLDSAAIDLHEFNSDLSKGLFQVAGVVQHALYINTPFTSGRRFFNAQWCWALGHIGILYQMIRWFHLHSPKTELILETQNKISNIYFLDALRPYLTIVDSLPESMREEAIYNAVYFGCPDGKHHVHDFMKLAEKECKNINLLRLNSADQRQVEKLMAKLNVKRPYVAVQARQLEFDPKRNVTEEQVEMALRPFLDKNYNVIITGLDNHSVLGKYPNVRLLPDPHLASFLLSAACDQFIGSDSGAWVIPWAYQRPVELINDKTMAWIYE